MPSMTRYIVFVTPPNNLYVTEAQARAAAEQMAKNSLGTDVQVWRLDGTRVAKYAASVEASFTDD